ncbi:MAG: electron transfer flavoprotein subunit beta/FixA family protein [Ignavibacteria bacterium]|nr:electron transfer flavoprotein subunit beta/FixA family protein [Ignavibacteria bacterium]
MKIVVCVSLVPDSTTKIKISDDGKSIDESGVTFIINPYDEYAVEESVQLKEKKGAETYAISFGTQKHKEAIKKAFQMGIDKGILIQTESDNYDSYTVAKNLAEAIKEINPDIIFFGKQSIDFDGLTVPGMVGELLGIPSVNVVTKIEYGDNLLTLEREIEGGKEVITTSIPAVIGTQKGLNTPRYPNLKSIMASKSKPIDEKKATYSGNATNVTEMKLPESKGKGKILTEGVKSVPELVNLLRNEAKVI